jgi:hypothetical protein
MLIIQAIDVFGLLFSDGVLAAMAALLGQQFSLGMCWERLCSKDGQG